MCARWLGVMREKGVNEFLEFKTLGGGGEQERKKKERKKEEEWKKPRRTFC